MRNIMHARTSVVRAAAVCAFALAAFAPASDARADDVVITEQARTHFAAGVALLQDPKAPRYEEAYREFKAAYAASPSYKILGNLGLCAMKIERDGEAIDAYTKYLAQAGADLKPDERDQIKRDLLTLKTGSVEVTISSDPPGATFTDVRQPVQGPEVRNAYAASVAPLTLRLRGGRHLITARIPGYEDATWEFEGSGTTLPPHTFKLEKPVEQVIRERPIPTSAFISGGVTVAFLATGTVMGVVALQRHNEYTSLNDGTHVSAANDTRSSGQTLNVITDIFLGAALIGAGVTTYLVLTRPTVERPQTQPATPTAKLGLRSVAPFLVTQETSANLPSANSHNPVGGGLAATFSIE